MAADSSTVMDRQSHARSAITNGALLPGVDGRSTWARRARDLISDHLSDLGGEDNTSAAERSIVRRACVLTVELERLEFKFAKADAASSEDLDLYQRTANSLRRLLEAIGLQRRTKTVPNLHDYLLEQQGHADAREEDAMSEIDQ
jgi:hypothetical protein